MHPKCCSIAIIFLLAHEARAVANGGPPQKDAHLLDELIQLSAFASLVEKPRTGVVYLAELPSTIAGMRASIVRLRSGSLHRRGFHHFHEFHLPRYLHQTSQSLRVALIYHNLGNWSSIYYSLPGYRFLTPVLGLLAYEATDLDSAHHREVGILASERPILIKFKNVVARRILQEQLTPKCVQFFADGSHRLYHSSNGTRCEAFSLGHYSIVAAESTLPQSQPRLSGDGGYRLGRIGRIFTALVGALLGAVVVIMILLCFPWRKRREMEEMVKRSERGQVLKSQNVGSARLPMGSFVRTTPTLEEDDVP